MANQKATEMKDLSVERVDGVDRPATGRKFILFKDESAGKGSQIMKGYAMTATAAAEVLKHFRQDGQAVVGKNTAVALNGLAQVLGAAPVFLSKAVPTHPYEFSEPDADKRGPADEKLGANFTPHAMPGSMVGAVQFSVKGVAAQKAGGEPAIAEDEDEEMKSKALAAKAKADDEKPKEDKELPPWMKSIVAASAAQAKSIEALSAAVEKIAKGERVAVAKTEDEPEAPRKPRPVSRQVDEDDEPAHRVTKSGRVSFADVLLK